jgi:hypothetical protein
MVVHRVFQDRGVQSHPAKDSHDFSTLLEREENKLNNFPTAIGPHAFYMKILANSARCGYMI